METYITVRDVLKTVQKTHENVQSQIAGHCKADRSSRAQMLLDYVRRQQGQIAEALAHFDETERETILDTWLQYGPEPRKPPVPEADDLEDDTSLEDICQLAIDMDDAFASFYADAAALVKLPQARQLFEQLSKQREADKAEIAKQTSALKYNE